MTTPHTEFLKLMREMHLAGEDNASIIGGLVEAAAILAAGAYAGDDFEGAADRLTEKFRGRMEALRSEFLAFKARNPKGEWH